MRRALLPCVLAVVTCVTPSASSVPPPVTIPAAFDRDISGDRLMVPLTVNGIPFECHLDSGGGAILALDEEAATRAEIKATTTGASAGVGATVTVDRRVQGATIALGRVSLANQTVILRPFEPDAPDFDCLFGLTLLRDYVVELDYAAPRLRLHDPRTYRPAPEAVAIPFTMENNHPLAPVTVTLPDGGRVTARMILDTGAAYYSAVLLNSFIVTHNLAARVGKTARGPQREPKDAGDIRLVAARPRSVALGPVQVENPVIALIQNDSPHLTMDGLLGAGFFTRFGVVFDYPGRRLFLSPGARVGATQLFDASGVGFAKTADNRDYVVNAIVPESPAAAAGVRHGDLLVSIDGRLARELSMKQILDILRRAGQTCSLRLRRDDRDLHVTLQLTHRL